MNRDISLATSPMTTTAAAAISATQFLRRGVDDAAVTGRSGACSFMLNVW